MTNSNNLLKDTYKELDFFYLLDFVSKYAYSESAKHKIKNLSPIEDKESLVGEIKNMKEIIHLMDKQLTIPIQGFQDIQIELQKSKINNSILLPEELLKILRTLNCINDIKRFFINNLNEASKLKDINQEIFSDKILSKHISEAIDNNGDIKDNASKELKLIRIAINKKTNSLRASIEKILKRSSDNELLQDDYYTIRDNRLVIPVKSENKRKVSGIIHGSSQTGSTVFIEPTEIIELNNELSLLKSEEQNEIYKILRNLTKEVGANFNSFVKSNEILIYLDMLNAKANFAQEFNALAPLIVDDNILELNNSFHPILVIKHGRENVVPMKISFENEVNGHLISGPNAGGKTVALKNVGLNLLMAFSGIFPLAECRTNIRKIYSSIGDNQSIENDLSTFSSQLQRIKMILDSSSNDTLILIDEICSGTDPKEGSALAAGIMDTMILYGSKFIVTTHQSSLKSYAVNQENIINSSLEFDETNLRPTYNFLSGIPGNSYAFNLAENVNMNKQVINRALSYLDKSDLNLEKTISELLKYKKEAEKIKKEAELKMLKHQKLALELESKIEYINSKKEKFLADAKEEASLLLKDANKIVENTIKEIQEAKRPISEIKYDYNKNKKNLEAKIQSDNKSKQKPKDTFKIGSRVQMVNSDETGIILELSVDNLNAVVEFNGLKFKINLTKLELLKDSYVKNKNKKPSKSDYINFDANTKIDLRGQRYNDAIQILDSFINDAIVSQLNSVTIIHGKGTGALKKAVNEYLSNNHSIISYRYGSLVEGGEGVTIAELN